MSLPARRPPGNGNGACKTRSDEPRPVLVVGGAGFIGTNLAHRLLSTGERVLIYDNLSRPGVATNLSWLLSQHGDLVEVLLDDVRDPSCLQDAVARCSWVFDFAAQVAVTTSLEDPLRDFDVNVRGTLNLLEALRRLPSPPPLLFTSTNKVYGNLSDVSLAREATRYVPRRRATLHHGIGEDRALDFHTPYGCSKGAAEQYVHDYARSFRLPTIVFRLSCVYGPHQFGTEDQGWVAHFVAEVLRGRPLTLYGDGRQVRDLLFIEDLVDAFLLARRHVDRLAGEVFNIGGGPENAVSVLEVVERIAGLHGARPDVRFGPWRCGDQQYYVSDTRRFQRASGWRPSTDVTSGIERLYHWMLESGATAAAPARVAAAPLTKPARSAPLAAAPVQRGG